MCGDSDIPTAAQLSNECFDAYRQKYAQELPEELRNNLEALTEHFYASGQLIGRFIPLVPWSRFRNTAPNDGHAAIADFLACGAVPLSITANYDTLVEAAASKLGEPDFCAITDADDVNDPRDHSPYLKIHGCALLARKKTVWCKPQIQDEPLSSQIARAETYLRAALNGKDLIFVGFWTDWAYLNDILEATVNQIEPRRIVLVDIAELKVLEEKAPDLWALCQSSNIIFDHVKEPADEFLNELRLAYSSNFMDRLVTMSGQAYEAHFGETPTTAVPGPWPANVPTLYGLRRNLTGAGDETPVREKNPIDSMVTAGAVLVRLLDKGADFDGELVLFDEQKVRIIAGQGVPLSIVKSRYVGDANNLGEDEVIICAGATDDGDAKPHIVRGKGEDTVIRGGLNGRWLTLEAAVDALEL